VLKLDNSSEKLASNNRIHVESVIKTFGKDQAFTDFLRVIADVLDYACDGHDSYLTLGTNKANDAILLTIKQEGKRAYVSALDLAGLSEACKSVL